MVRVVRMLLGIRGKGARGRTLAVALAAQVTTPAAVPHAPPRPPAHPRVHAAAHAAHALPAAAAADPAYGVVVSVLTVVTRRVLDNGAVAVAIVSTSIVPAVDVLAVDVPAGDVLAGGGLGRGTDRLCLALRLRERRGGEGRSEE